MRAVFRPRTALEKRPSRGTCNVTAKDGIFPYDPGISIQVRGNALVRGGGH